MMVVFEKGMARHGIGTQAIVDFGSQGEWDGDSGMLHAFLVFV